MAEGWEGGCGRRAPAEAGAGAGQSPQAADPCPLCTALPPPLSKSRMKTSPSLCAPLSSRVAGQPPQAPAGAGLALVPSQSRTTLPGGKTSLPWVPSASKPSSAPHQPHLCLNSGASKQVAHPAPGSQSTSGASQPPEVWQGGKGGKRVGPGCPQRRWRRMAVQASRPRSCGAQAPRRPPALLLVKLFTQTFTKVSKKKKMARSRHRPHPDREGPPGAELAPTAAPGRAEGPPPSSHTLRGAGPGSEYPQGAPWASRPLGPPPAPRPP